MRGVSTDQNRVGGIGGRIFAAIRNHTVLESATAMCFFSAPSMPAPPPMPTPPPDPPQMADKAVSDAANGVRAKAAAAQGYGSTLLTGGQGLSTPASTTQKTLLGA